MRISDWSSDVCSSDLQARIDSLHRIRRALGAARARQHRPTLRNGIDLAFRVFVRTQRRAVVEVGTPVPLPVPAVLVDIDAQPFRLFAAVRRKGAIIAGIGQIGEPPLYLVMAKSQTYAFARALVAYLVRASVSVQLLLERQSI